MNLLQWNLSRLKVKSRPLTGPLPLIYVRELISLVESLNGVYLSGIQVGDPRQFAIPNPRFKDFPVIYNPEIIEQYDLVTEGEGCLSFPGMWIKIPRYKYVKIRFRDGNWKPIEATFGDDKTFEESEQSLLSKAIQHECFHMLGGTIHERIKSDKTRIKVLAAIQKSSIAQNKNKGIPELEEGPAELDPSTLPVEPEKEETECV